MGFIFHAHFTSFHTRHSFLLTSSVCLFILFHSCCSHTRLFGKTLVHEFPISYSHTEWYFFFDLWKQWIIIGNGALINKLKTSANVCPCACRKVRLIMGYKMSHTTGLLYAWSSCMQWGVWVQAVRHWVILVQVIYKGGWVIFLKNQGHPWEEILSYSHSRKPDLPVTHSSPFSSWLSVLFFFPPLVKPHRQGRVMCFVGGSGNIAVATALPPSSFVYCIINIK